MLTKSDKIALERVASPRYRRICSGVLVFMILLSVALAVFHLVLSLRFASDGSVSYSEIISLLASGFKINSNYSGAVVYAVEMLSSTIFDISLGLVVGVYGVLLLQHFKRLERIWMELRSRDS